MLNAEYAVIVRNQTRLERLLQQCSTRSMARFQVESQGGDFTDYEAEHDVYHESLARVQKELSRLLRNKIIDKSFVPSFIFKGQIPLVIVVGQDGLVANTAKYVDKIPIVAVNPEPVRYDGVLLPFGVTNFVAGVEQVISGRYPARMVSMAEAKLRDGQRLLAFNDLFIGAASHVSARYRIRYGKLSEAQLSSGIIVSTKSGSTGWLSSVFNMSLGVQRFLDRTPDRKAGVPAKKALPGVKLEEKELFFAVREPFKSRQTGIDLINGSIKGDTKLHVESFMPTGGVIFSDGIESDFLQFTSGSIVAIGLAPETATLVQRATTH